VVSILVFGFPCSSLDTLAGQNRAATALIFNSCDSPARHRGRCVPLLVKSKFRS